MTRWAKEVSPENAHGEYPRPQMAREEWKNLNGLWDYAIRPRVNAEPGNFDGKILVPFPVESALSGVMQRVSPEQRVWYQRAVTVPKEWSGNRVLLHFEAVDWEATVSIDGRTIGTHRGGYSPFTFDVTDSLPPGSTHQLTVAVWDPSDAGTQPCGKQHNKPEEIWYTPSTGIWQTVWLEFVPQTYVQDVRLQHDVAKHQVTIETTVAGPTKDCHISATVSFRRDGTKSHIVGKGSARPGAPITIDIPPADVRLWSPDSPFLYDVAVWIKKDRPAEQKAGDHDDRVACYFAMRSIGVAQGSDKTARIVLNGKPVFMIGPLDQGFWPDGLYTAPTDEALKFDLEVTKKLGFNLIRKHVKVEPARWYYWCDRLGLIVWQDMPSGDRPAKWPSPHAEIKRSAESTADYERELKEIIDSRRQFPCIVAWVPFNEGWGQFDTVRISKMVKDIDPTRLVNPASGGNDFPVGDMHDVHYYPGPAAPPAEAARSAVLGEYGGLGLPLSGHLWVNDKRNWGYRKYKTRDELTAAYVELARKLRPLIESRLSAAVYTQTTDVETEVNGLMTYDRELIKMDVDQVRKANLRLCEPLPAR